MGLFSSITKPFQSVIGAVLSPGSGAMKGAGEAAGRAVNASRDNLAFRKDVYSDSKERLDDLTKQYNDLFAQEMENIGADKGKFLQALSQFDEERGIDYDSFRTSMQGVKEVSDDFHNAYIDSFGKYTEAMDGVMDNYQDLDEATTEYQLQQTVEMKEWQSMFGSPMENLADYYNNLNPNDFAADAKAHLTREFQNTADAITRHMAKRGILDSGMYDEATLNNYAKLATARAGIDVKAKEIVNNKLQQFVAFGQSLKPKEGAILNALATNAQLQNNFSTGEYKKASNAQANEMNANQWTAGVYGNRAGKAPIDAYGKLLDVDMVTSGTNKTAQLMGLATSATNAASSGVSMGYNSVAQAEQGSAQAGYNKAKNSQDAMGNIMGLAGRVIGIKGLFG